MPKRSSKPRLDVNEIAKLVADEVMRRSKVEKAPDGKNPAAVSLGRLGGLKGGRARADSLSKDKRSEIARKAAKARWNRQKGQ